MATITVVFKFSDGCEVPTIFDVDSGLHGQIVDYIDEKIIDISDGYADEPDFEGDIDCQEWYVLESDISDCPSGTEDWDDFGEGHLDDWGEYIEKVEEHGEAFVMRYADIADLSCMDEGYEGCWSSEEEFVQHLCDECVDIPDHLKFYIDWEKMAHDYMMDYSSYGGYDGYHIFSNH